MCSLTRPLCVPASFQPSMIGQDMRYRGDGRWFRSQQIGVGETWARTVITATKAKSAHCVQIRLFIVSRGWGPPHPSSFANEQAVQNYDYERETLTIRTEIHATNVLYDPNRIIVADLPQNALVTVVVIRRRRRLTERSPNPGGEIRVSGS